MTIIVGNAERSELNAAVARARAHPVPWEVLRRVSEQDVEDQPLADEPTPPEFVDLPFGYVVAINFEEQPAGTCLHISVSGPWPRVTPNMVVCAMIFSALDVPEEADDVWTEEFLIDGNPGGRTLNVVWLVEPRNRDARRPAPRETLRLPHFGGYAGAIMPSPGFAFRRLTKSLTLSLFQYFRWNDARLGSYRRS